MLKTILMFGLLIDAYGFGAAWNVGKADEPAKKEKGKACDFPTKPGIYKEGDWEYEYRIESPKTRSETRVGKLKKNGKDVEGKKDEVIETPLGKFKYFETMYNKGWLNTTTFDTPVFKGDDKK